MQTHHLDKERELVKNLHRLNKSLTWHAHAERSIARRWIRAAFREPNIAAIQHFVESQYPLLSKTENLDLIGEIHQLNHHVHAVFHKSPEKSALMAQLHKLESNGDERVIHEIESEIARQIPPGYFPPFKRDTKGHLVDPSKQLHHFREFLIEALKALGDPIHATHLEKDKHFTVKTAVRSAIQVADLAFLACFESFFQRMDVHLPKDPHKGAKEGRDWLHTHYANPQKLNEWKEEHPLNEEETLPSFLLQPVHARHLVPSEMALLRNKSVQFMHRITTLPPQLAGNKNIFLLIINKWGGKTFPKELYKLPLYFLSVTTDSITTSFPHGLAHLKETLNIFNCIGPSIDQLPDELFHLFNLSFLRFDNSNIESVSREISKLVNLKHLELQYNPFLEKLPPEIGQLTQLKTLSCKACDLLELPKEIGNCASLVSLDITENPRLKHLPNELGHLKNLEVLLCDNGSLPYLPSNLVHCRKLVQIGHLWHVSSGIPLPDFLTQRK